MKTVDELKDLFDRNLACLEKTHPPLHRELVSLPRSSRCKWIETDSSHPTLEVTLPGYSKPILFHSRHDPKREAQRQIESMAPKGLSVYVFVGLGLGYTLEALWEMVPQTINTILVIERSLEVLYYFLHMRDWTQLLSNPNIRFLVPESPEDILPELQPFLPQIMGYGIRFIDHPPSFQVDLPFYKSLMHVFKQFLQRAAAESEFLVQNGSLIQRNAILNLPSMCKSHGLGPLRGCLYNQPAVLIAAGPSLSKNLHQVVLEREHVWIFCVDTAYRLVCKQGIRPDFVAATDPTELNMKHFENITPTPEEVLLFESDVYPAIPQDWPGYFIFLNSEKAAINRWIEETVGPFGCFDQGLSVAHTLFQAAMWMECNPIILIGFDLAYPPEGGKTHADGTALVRTVNHAALGESKVIIHASASHPGDTQEPIEWVLGIRGTQVPTSKTMAVFLQELSNRIKQSHLTVYDATEGGALIEGTIPTQLSTALASIDKTNPRSDIISFLEQHRDPQDKSRIEAFNQLIKPLQDAVEVARTGFRIVQEQLGNPRIEENTFRESDAWKAIDDCFWTVYRDGSVQTALGQALFPSLFLFIRQDKDETNKVRLQKYAQVFDSIVRLSEEFIPCLEQSRELIRQYCNSNLPGGNGQ